MKKIKNKFRAAVYHALSKSTTAHQQEDEHIMNEAVGRCSVSSIAAKNKRDKLLNELGSSIAKALKKPENKMLKRDDRTYAAVELDEQGEPIDPEMAIAYLWSVAKEPWEKLDGRNDKSAASFNDPVEKAYGR
jgi:hypothetical protein